MLDLTAINSFLYLKINSLERWSDLAGLLVYHKILTSWWNGIHSLIYYYIGCYLKDYRFKIKTWKNVLLIFFFGGLVGIYTFWHSMGATFIQGPCQFFARFIF